MNKRPVRVAFAIEADIRGPAGNLSCLLVLNINYFQTLLKFICFFSRMFQRFLDLIFNRYPHVLVIDVNVEDIDHLVPN